MVSLIVLSLSSGLRLVWSGSLKEKEPASPPDYAWCGPVLSKKGNRPLLLTRLGLVWSGSLKEREQASPPDYAWCGPVLSKKGNRPLLLTTLVVVRFSQRKGTGLSSGLRLVWSGSLKEREQASPPDYAWCGPVLSKKGNRPLLRTTLGVKGNRPLLRTTLGVVRFPQRKGTGLSSGLRLVWSGSLKEREPASPPDYAWCGPVLSKKGNRPLLLTRLGVVRFPQRKGTGLSSGLRLVWSGSLKEREPASPPDYAWCGPVLSKKGNRPLLLTRLGVVRFSQRKGTGLSSGLRLVWSGSLKEREPASPPDYAWCGPVPSKKGNRPLLLTRLGVVRFSQRKGTGLVQQHYILFDIMEVPPRGEAFRGRPALQFTIGGPSADRGSVSRSGVRQLIGQLIEGPSAVIEGPSADRGSLIGQLIEGPSAVIEGPSAVIEGPSAVIEGPSADRGSVS
ncbi:hypothetical protein NQZ68_025400 [Dissostichus eleginoides]|nr:hypothetical protein NQZ68_025400 [Dissostichus eleginoides]